jgi:hypothetical protein
MLPPQNTAASTGFLEAFPGVLSPAECEAIIARFERDDRKFPSRTQTKLHSPIRSGTMLPTVLFPEWADVAVKVEKIVEDRLKLYAEKYVSIRNLTAPGNYQVSGALIERIEPGQGYGFHIDAGPWGTQDRILATLIYLRDIQEGGFTEFPYQSLRVPPRAGLMVMFPPFWTHLHRGTTPVTGVKYNISNFVCLVPPAAPRPERTVAEAGRA